MKKSTLLSKMTVAGLLLMCGTKLMAQPAAAAPTPATLDADNTFTIFSDVNNPISGITFQNWGDVTGTTNTIQVAGNNTLEITKTINRGILFASKDATAFTHVCLDVWIDETKNNFEFGLISDINGTKVDARVSTPLEGNKWNHFEFPISQFTNLNLSKLDGAVIADKDWSYKTIYVDNIYLYKENATSIAPENKIEFRTFPNPVVNELCINSEEELKSISILNLVGQNVKTIAINTKTAMVDMSDMPQGAYFVKVLNANGISTTQKIIKQ